MKRKTLYTACLNNGKIIKAKTIARLRRIAPQIRKVWQDTELVYKQTKGKSTQRSGRFTLDKLLKIPTKGRYAVEYFSNWAYLDSDCEDGILKIKASLRERYIARHQHVNGKSRMF